MSIADDTRWLDATAQAELVRSGQVSPTELVEAALDRIDRYDGLLNSVIHRVDDLARATAAAPLPDGPFRGVPFAIKDLNATCAGEPYCAGNAALKEAGYVATDDTTLVTRYRAAGLVFVGRTNTPEFGSLPTTEPVAFGPTRNPWDLDRSPGGSSGGAAAAVAAGLVPFAHASDGGGSIRIPAAACGLVGLKPSQGRMTLGPIGDESGLSVQHAVTRTVRDCAALLDATAGPGVGDTVVAPAPARAYLAEVGADPGRLRVGFVTTAPQTTVDPACQEAARRAAALLESLGHDVEETHPDALFDTSFAPRFGALWAAMMDLTIRRIGTMLGRPLTEDEVEPVNWAMASHSSAASATDYAESLSAVAQYRRRLQQWWADGWDLLVTPTLATPPWLLGEIANNPEQPLAPMGRAGELVPFTPSFNTSGQPAISLPLHWTDDGLPVGVQLVAAYGREDVLLRVAAQLEQAAPWAHRHPAL